MARHDVARIAPAMRSCANPYIGVRIDLHRVIVIFIARKLSLLDIKSCAKFTTFTSAHQLFSDNVIVMFKDFKACNL